MQVARVFKKALIGKVQLPISQQCVYMITSWNEAWGTGSIKTSSAWKRLVRVLNKCNLPHSVINLRKLLLILSITNAGLVKVHEVDRDSSEALQTITECRTIIYCCNMMARWMSYAKQSHKTLSNCRYMFC